MTEKKATATLPDPPPPLVLAAAGIEPVSQKARGVFGLPEIVKDHRQHFPASMIPPHFLITDLAQLDSQEWKDHDLAKRDEIFVRPCPVTPRHGFVESRPIKSDGNGAINQGIKEIFLQAKAADPKAELLIAEPVSCKWSAVWTPHSLVFGAGNDGATSGKPFLKLALPGTNPFATMQEKYGVIPPDVPYLEMLTSTENKLAIVQFRGGPSTGVVGDNYIPFDTTVKNVYSATGDLLEYEKLIKSLKRGDVVYNAGDGLTSHYAAHCVLNQIPYITDHQPQIGEHLTATTGSLPAFDISLLKQGIIEGMNLEVGEKAVGPLAKMSVLATHYSQFWRTGDSVVALGRFAALLVRISAVLCINESKYISPTKPEHSFLSTLTKDFPGGRNSVYAGFINQTRNIRGLLRKTLDGFMYANWGGGFGGQKWGDCAAHAVALDDLLVDILEEKNPAKLQEQAMGLSVRMHGLINASHNNGKLLTKVLPNNFLDQMAEGGTKHALELMMMYAHALFEKKGASWLPSDKPAYVPEHDDIASAMKWWQNGKWMSLDDAKLLVTPAIPEPEKPTPIVAAKKEPPKEPVVPMYSIRPQIRTNGSTYRCQIWWTLDNAAEVVASLPKKTVKKKVIKTVAATPDLPADYPLVLTPTYKKKQEYGYEEVEQEPQSLTSEPHYTEQDRTLTLSKETISYISSYKEKNNSFYSGSNKKYTPCQWEYVNEDHDNIRCSVNGEFVFGFNLATGVFTNP